MHLKVAMAAWAFPVFILALIPELTDAPWTGVSVLVTAILFGLNNLYIARTARMALMKEVVKAIEPVATQVREMAPVLDRVDTHVNGEKSNAVHAAAAKDLEIRLKNEMLEEMRRAMALLAQAKATVDMAGAISQAAVAGATTSAVPATASVPGVVLAAPNAVLKKIEANTKETAENTKRTDDAVADLKESKE